MCLYTGIYHAERRYNQVQNQYRIAKINIGKINVKSLRYFRAS